MAKRKSIKTPWGLVALLSFVVMAVFFYDSPLIVLISGAVFFVACIVLCSRHFDYLYKAASGYYDNEQPIEMDIRVNVTTKD